MDIEGSKGVEAMANDKRKALPIGIANFYKLRNYNFCYVDKTRLIQRLLDTQTDAILFTRPRRFGKSLALSMLRRFFDCNEKDKNRSLFEGLAVAQSERYMSEQGKYPVIFFDFKAVEGETQEELKESLRNALHDALLPYEYLVQSNKLLPREKERMDRLLRSQTSISDISTSLSFVCSLLFKHHGQPTVILIDEYDAPLQSAYKFGFYQPICTVMRKLFSSALKGNDSLRLGVVTGVLRIAKDSLFSGLNNLEVDTIMSEDYADCFGFTQAEVDQLANHYGANAKRKEIQEWYDGYRFGELDIYNPWSVLQYLRNKCTPQPYWLQTSSNDLTIEFLHRLENNKREQVWELYRGGTVKAAVDTSVSYQQLGSTDTDILFSLMAVTGYLKPIKALAGGRYLLQVPNAEVNSVFATEIASYLKREHSVTDLQDLLDALLDQDHDAFVAQLRNILMQTVSYLDGQEAFYHGFMTCLLLGLNEKYEVLSNREAGQGRADILLQPRFDKSLPGFVFEFKRGDETANLDNLAEAALRQIAEKQYAAAFPPEIREVRCYGLAFCKKDCDLKWECIAR